MTFLGLKYGQVCRTGRHTRNKNSQEYLQGIITVITWLNFSWMTRQTGIILKTWHGKFSRSHNFDFSTSSQTVSFLFTWSLDNHFLKVKLDIKRLFTTLTDSNSILAPLLTEHFLVWLISTLDTTKNNQMSAIQRKEKKRKEKKR